MKTILFVDHTAKLGGGEIALCDLIGALDKSIFKPIVLLSSDGPLAGKLRQAGVETHVLPLPKSIVELRKDSLELRSVIRVRDIVAVFQYARLLSRWARRHNVDIIHANSLKADICGGIAGRMAGIPIIWHVRDTIAPPYLPARVASAFRLLARYLPNAVISNSYSTMKGLALPAGKMSAVVYSGIQPENVVASTIPAVSKNPLPLAKHSSRATSRPIVSLVGRIAEWKGQHILIAAAAKVLESYPDAEFWIAGAPMFGEVDYEQRIKDLVISLGIAKSVKLLGFRNDVHDIMEQSTIVVHASIIGEPFGQVVVQGMAAGKPVIATNGAAVPEIVVPGVTGLLVPMDDVPAMADAIEWVLGHPDEAERMGSAAKARAYECFSISQSASLVESLYNRILGDGKAHDREESAESCVSALH